MTAHTVDAQTAQLRVFTYKEGLLSAVAHDLEIDVQRFSITANEGWEGLTATVDLTSLRVLHPMVHGRAAPGKLSADDLATIEGTVQAEVFRGSKEARFEAREVERYGDGFEVEGLLTLNGQTHPLACEMRRHADHYVIDVELDQRRWGLKPYTAMMGTLRIKPELRVRLTIPVE